MVKRILIVGEGSYIGQSFANWLQQWPERYLVSTVGTINQEWETFSFDGYDALLHVAGIAHISTDPKLENVYYQVNRDLAIEVARRAQKADISQFIFMSSMIIYGDGNRIAEKKVITKETIPQPANFYGKSKLEADLAIQKMVDGRFKPVIIRTPMVYGPGCKGNFPRLVQLAKVCRVFPDFDNARSMIYIDNLCELIRLLIDNKESGVFFPQNEDYVRTSEMVRFIAEAQGKKIKLTKLFNPLLKAFGANVNLTRKVFGTLIYDKNISQYKEKYCVVDLEKSIKSIVV